MLAWWRICSVLQAPPGNCVPSLVRVLTNGVSRLQTNEPNSPCWPSCHGHILSPSWSKACNPARSGGVYDHHLRVYHGLILSGR